MLDLKLHIINKNEFQTKYSKTKSLEKVQYFPPEKQAPWVPSSARSNRRPRCSKPGCSTFPGKLTIGKVKAMAIVSQNTFPK